MKTTRHRIYTLDFAVSLALTTNSLHATTNELPAPKPEFLNAEQLAEWRAKKTAEFEAKKAVETLMASANAGVFYTGKPYLEDSGTYAFRFRSYSPEFSRRTSVDPSGFPDWPNNYLCSNQPLSGFDPDGLYWRENTSGVGASYVQISNGGPGHYNCYNVAHPNLNFTGQCATGAQYAAGTVIDGKIHDAPATSNWVQGAAVSTASALTQGTMIAYGWNSNGNYPNAPIGNHTALFVSQTDTHITVDEQYVGPNGPTGFQTNTYEIGLHEWHVVTTTIQFDLVATESFLE